jgi:hypothetical protein
MNRYSLRLASSLIVAGVLIAPAIGADQPEARAERSGNHEAGLRVYVDPESGAVVSQPVTEQQRRDAAKAHAEFQQDESATVEAVATDGSPMRILNGQYEMAFGVEVDADGTRRVICNDAAHASLGKHRHAATNPAAAADER